MSSRRVQRILLLIILLFQALIGAAYTFSVPLWQNHEADFFTVIRILDQEGRFANESDYPPGEAAERQATHPPLYPLIGFPVVAAFDDGDPVPPETLPNLICPGGEAQNTPITRYIPTPAYTFPHTGAAAAGISLRLLNVGFGLIAVIFTYAAARTAFPARPALALLAAALLAFEPYTSRLNATLNNDSLLLALSAAVLFFCVHLLNKLTLFSLIGLIAATALAMLTKVNGWLFFGFSGLVLLVLVWRHRSRPAARWILIGLGVIALIGVGIGGYNVLTVGSVFGRYRELDAFALNLLSNLAIPREVWSSTLEATRLSYLEPLAELNPRNALTLLYTALPLIGIIGMVGALVMLTRQRDGRGALSLAAALILIALTVLLVLYRNRLNADASNTTAYNTAFIFAPLRYYATALPALVFGMAAGLSTVQARLPVHPISVGAVGLWFIVAVLGVVVLLIQRPLITRLDRAQFDALDTIRRVETGGSNAALPSILAYQLDFGRDVGFIDLTLYATTETALTQNYALNAALLTADGQRSPCEFLPARGAYPTTHWQPGEIVVIYAAVPYCAPSPTVSLHIDWHVTTPSSTTPGESPGLTIPIVNSVGIGRPDTCPANLGVIADAYQIVRFNSPATIRRGDTYLPSLNWIVYEPSSDALVRVFEFYHQTTGQVYPCSGSPSDVFHPITTWERGEYVYFDQCAMRFPTDAPMGMYTVEVGIRDAAGAWLSPGTFPVGEIELRAN